MRLPKYARVASRVRGLMQKPVKDDVPVPGASPAAGPRVPAADRTSAGPSRAGAAGELSAALSRRRRRAGLTQSALASVMGVSVTTVGHAETGHVWQSRGFWESADKVLGAGGELLAAHDAYRAASVVVSHDGPPAVTVAISGPVTSVAVTWADGSSTAVPVQAFPGRP